MKTILLILVLSLNLISCGSINFSDPVAAAKAKADNLRQEDRILGAPFPAWIKNEGISAGFIYVIGEYETTAEMSQSMILEGAKADAEMQLVNRMPADYKLILKKVLDETQLDKFTRSFIKKINLNGLADISFTKSRQVCRKKIVFGAFGETITRLCYAQAKIPVLTYNKALNYELKKTVGKSVVLPSDN